MQAYSDKGPTTGTTHPQPTGTRVLPPGYLGPIGPVFATDRALEDIVAGALAGLSVSNAELPANQRSIIERGIQRGAASNAPHMQAAGPLMWAELKPGQHAEGLLSLESARCYVIVGFAVEGVTDFRINLIAAPPFAPGVLAQSQGGSTEPSLGTPDRCIRHNQSSPLRVWVDLHLVAGRGVVGARAYQTR
jgi:hypothetical protein